MRARSLAWVALLASVVGCDGEQPRSIDDLKVKETIDLPGLSGRVDVVRDGYGRPHVYAENFTDASMVMGWLHASDRFLQMDLLRRLPSSRLAELVGAVVPERVEVDKSFHTLGLASVAQAEYDAFPADSPVKAMYDSYAVGVNARLAAFTVPPAPEYDLFSYPFDETPPWTPTDSLAVGRMLAMNLSLGSDYGATLDERVEGFLAAFPPGDARSGILADSLFRFSPAHRDSIVGGSGSLHDPSLVGAISATSQGSRRAVTNFLSRVLDDPMNPFSGPGKGSNNWVVAGSRTSTGHPILCNDPHLGGRIPTTFYEIHLNTTRAGGAVNVIGVSLPGIPGVIIGANGDVTWGVTNSIPDVTDFYAEQYTLDSGGAMHVAWDSDGPAGPATMQSVPLTRDDAIIEVRNIDGTVTEVPDTAWRVPHRNNGVILPETISTNGTAVSVAWPGFQPTLEATTFYLLNHATNEADVINAASFFDIPAQNLVYADKDGNIGYVANGWIPVRADDDNDLHTDPPFLTFRGDDGAHEWIGRVPFEDVPRVSNPTRGWIGSANNDPLGVTFDNDPLNDSIYHSWTYDKGFRIHRIIGALKDNASVSVRDMMELQGDHASNLGSAFVPYLLESLGTDYPSERSLLERWSDRGFNAESGVGDVSASEIEDAAATSLFNVWQVAMIRRALKDEWDAAGVATDTFGDDLSDGARLRCLLLLLQSPSEAATWDESLGDSLLWDDLDTPALETRDEIFRAALDEAVAWLASPEGFGSADPATWTWGEIHRLRLTRLSGFASFNVPNPADPELGEGFPRHSDAFAVDPSYQGLGDFDFNHSHASAGMRMIVDLTPGRMRMFNILPGGVSDDPESKHYDDQAYLFAENEYLESWYRERDVVRHASTRVIFRP